MYSFWIYLVPAVVYYFSDGNEVFADLLKPQYNVAVGKPTYNSTYSNSRRESWKAVNGCKKDYYNQNPHGWEQDNRTCCFQSSTESSSQAWWSVDLTAAMPVVSVTITADPNSSMVISVSAANISYDPNFATDSMKCTTNSVTFTAYGTTRIQCTGNIIARYVLIQLIVTSNQKFLSLCDVQVETAGRFNAALGRATWQSTTVSGIRASAYKSVDGSLSNEFWNGQCSHTYNDTNPWWSVDLGQIQTVYSVTLVNRGDGSRRLKWLVISVSNETHTPSESICGTHEPEIPTGAAQHIPCTKPLHARFVIVQKIRDSELTMCEVIVETACSYNRYGTNCWQKCNCRNKVLCDRFTGECPGGLCEEGFKGDSCDTVCTDGTFGYNCTKTCNCLEDKPCDPINGSCPNGLCNPGFKGNNCTTGCPYNRYGVNCLQKCNCRKVSCDRFTGQCPSGLCEKGYKGERCDKVCTTGTFGYNCTNTCNCFKNKPCTPTDGSCPDGLCKSGFMGNNCSVVCEDDAYGVNCSKSCPNCKNNQPCDKVTGHCPGGLCEKGYNGIKCDTMCPSGTYGSKCLYNCSMFCRQKGMCNPINGHCLQGQCVAGYSGDKCDQSCPAGKFGLDCLSSCRPHCKGTCSPVDGACLVGCEDGWTGEKCENVVGKQSNTVIIVLEVVICVFIIAILSLNAVYFFRQKTRQPKAQQTQANPPIECTDLKKMDNGSGNVTQDSLYYNVRGEHVDTEMGSSSGLYVVPEVVHDSEPTGLYDSIRK